MKLSLISAALCVVLAVLGIYVAKSLVPDAIIQSPAAQIIDTQKIAPQGWAFFTRDAQEEQISVWRELDGTWAAEQTIPNASPSEFLGLGRGPRANAIQQGADLEAASKVATQCDPKSTFVITVHECLTNAVAIRLNRKALAWKTCGEFALVLQKPLPWVWASKGADEIMPVSLQRYNVAC